MDITIHTTVAALALGRICASSLQFSASGSNRDLVGNEHCKRVGISDLESDDHHLGHDPVQFGIVTKQESLGGITKNWLGLSLN